MLTIRDKDPIAIEAQHAIHNGDLTSLERLLTENPRLASITIENRKGRLRTLLHVATDWPGHFPNGRAIVACLIKSGANPNARPFEKDETPLHWAASSDDVEVADALSLAALILTLLADRSVRLWKMRSVTDNGRLLVF